MLLLILACLPTSGRDWDSGFPEADSDADTDADTDSDSDGDSDADSDSDSDADGDGDVDRDGDGYDEDEDCDDNDEDVNPGVRSDECDGVDNDCDSGIDEDFDDDEYEPNDEESTDLGDLTPSGGAVIEAYQFPESDVDIFIFYLEDGWWDSFDFNVTLSPAISVDGILELYWYPDDETGWEFIELADATGKGGAESIYRDGDAWSSDTAWYGVIVSSGDGESCDDPYYWELDLP